MGDSPRDRPRLELAKNRYGPDIVEQLYLDPETLRILTASELAALDGERREEVVSFSASLTPSVRARLSGLAERTG